MHKYIFLLPLLAFTFSCNASATKSFSLVMPVSVSGESTMSQTGYADDEEPIDYTGVGLRYEAKQDSIGFGVEFTPSATYAMTDLFWLANGDPLEFSSTEIGVFARKYLADDMFFIEAGTMFGLGLDANVPTGYTLPDSGAYANLKLAVGSRVDFGEAMFAEISAGLIQSMVPATTEDGAGAEFDNSISAFGFNVGLGMNF